MHNDNAVNALKEIRVRIDEANREYDDMAPQSQLRHGEEVWATCVDDIRSMVSSALANE